MGQSTLQIAATFTAEPIKNAVDFLLEMLGVSARIEFAPFNQVFQELLTPNSSFAQNENGVNILLVRLEDLASVPQEKEELRRNAQELVAAVRTAAVGFRVPLLVAVCPASGALLANDETGPWLEQIERNLIAELASLKGLYLIGSQEFRECSFAEYDNPRGQKLGSVPYTSRFYSVLGQLLTRRVYSLMSPPHKVIAVDCDQTLWKGVCGEDGPHGIELDPARLFLQEFLRTQYESGMLLCLASKNNEPDVWEVFSDRHDMRLKREHIVSSRINWERKSENLKSLARELQLGLDSFIFIDDDPVVCAEVEASCPTVLTICLPEHTDQIPSFFRHHWAFDHLATTAEDNKRTALYRENAERNQLLEQSISLTDFLNSLDLQCEITPAGPEHLPRVAQLTQRTNQFNATTIRRNEQEIQQLLNDSVGRCLVVHVRDRFGDYGLVGALIYFVRDLCLEVETFLLSCRALGRGVEHKMLSALAQEAAEKQLDHLAVHFVPSPKNLPARVFLEQTGAAFKEENDERIIFRYPTETAAQITYSPELTPAQSTGLATDLRDDGRMKTINEHGQIRAAGLRRIALELYEPDALMKCLRSSLTTRPGLAIPYVEATTEAEAQLVAIWEDILNVHPVGVLDDFFELGGSSLLAVSLFVEVAEKFGKELPLATLFTAPTVRSQALTIDDLDQESQWRYLVPIQAQGNNPPLYCMHAAGGNVLFYRDLANHLGDEQPVYGLQAREMEDTGTYLNRVEDMATQYIREILSFQTTGPYYLCGSSFGGLVAYEVAQQLSARGKEVELLALFDTYGPGYPQLRRHSNTLTQKVGRVATRVNSLGSQLRQLKMHEINGFLRVRARKASNRLKRKWLWRKNEFQIKYSQATGRQLPKDMQRNHKAIQQALETYVPQPCAGKLTLFRASTQPKGIIPDPQLGWSGLPAEGIDLYESPGTHGAMTVDPYARALAYQLKSCLAQNQEVPVTDKETHLRSASAAA